MKRLTICIVALFAMACMNAQSIYMPHTKVSETTDVFLGGKAGMTILSPHNDLVVVPIPDDPLDEVKAPVKEGEHFRYDLSLNIPDTEKTAGREFRVSRQGKSVSIKFKEIISENKRVTYKVAEVENPIMVQKNTDNVGLGSTSNEETCIEIVTPIELEVRHSDNLPCRMTKSVQENGAYRISLFVNLKQMREKAQKFFSTMDEHRELLAKEESNTATDADLDQLDKLEKEVLPPLRNSYMDMLSVILKGANTNDGLISLGDESGIALNPQERVSYTVILMKETVYATAYSKFIESAEDLEEKLKFGQAKEYYEQALAAADKPAGCEELLNEKIANCTEYADINMRAVGAVKKVQELQGRGMVKESEVLALLEAAAKCYETLYQRTALPLAKSRFDKVSEALRRTPWVIEGVVRGGKFKQGIKRLYPIAGCKVSFMPSKHMENQEMIELGVTDANGKYHVELNKASSGLLHFSWWDAKEKENRNHSIYFGVGNKEHISWDVTFDTK